MKYTCLNLLIFFIGLNFLNAQKEGSSFTKDTLVVGYNINPPFIYVENEKLQGINYRMWQKITENDNSFYKFEYHPLDSLLLGLSKGTIDIGLSPLTITGSRIKEIDFSIPYYVSHSSAINRKMSIADKFKSFFSSISIISLLKVLGLLFIILSVFGFLVWIFERKKNEEFGKGLKGFWNGLWWSAVTMTTVGYGDKSPKTIGGRIIGLIWMFAAIILISSITAGITSSLTVKKLGWNNNDLSSFKDITIGTIAKSATEQKLQNNYWNNLKSYHTIDELLQGLEKNEIQVATHDDPVLRYTVNHNKAYADFAFLDVRFNQALYAVGFSKGLNAKKKEELSKKIFQFTETNDWKILLTKNSLIEHQNLMLETK